MYNPTKERPEQTSVPGNSVACSSSTTTNIQAYSSQTTTNLTSQKRLTDKHFTHCCGSDINQKQRGLNPDWIAANCYSVDIKQASQLLGYPARSGGIILSGSNGQFQFRPDQPWSDKQGKKAPKYRTAFKDEYDALLPAHPTDPYFWHDKDALKARCWLIDGHPYIIITEGGFKAICACFHGLPTAALLGVEMGLTSAKSDPQGKRYLVSALERLAKARFGFILAFDTDISTKPHVREALHKLGCQLTKFNTPVQVLPNWDEQLGKGIDDYIQMNNIEKFRELLTKSISFESWVEQHQRDERGETPKLSALHRAWAKVLAEYGDRLRFNEMTRCIELDGEAATDLEGFYLDLALVHNRLVTKTIAYDLVIRCAKQNPYHPVKDYLNHVADTVAPIDIRSLSHSYFGTNDPIYDEMMYRHLIGSVARIFKPGCKKDEAVILKGKQGVLKSTFWKVLYGEDFFSDSLKGTDRDDLLVLHQYWALELAEFETMTSKKQAGDLKAFLSASSDTFREPYARHSQSRQRQSVIVGSVNPDAFLVDETGNRRYWVIPVSNKRIDLERVSRERDAIWAAAVLAYRNSVQWHLSYATEQKISELNQDYCHTDSWEVPISNYLQGRNVVTIFELLTQALDFEASRIGKRDEMRVSSILRALEWQKTLATYQGKRQKVWMKTDPPLCDPPHDPPISLEVDRGGNRDMVGVTAISDPPDPPSNQTFSNSIKHPLTSEEVLINEQKFEPKISEVDQQDKTVTPQGFDPTDLPLSTPRATIEVDQQDKTVTPQGFDPIDPPLSTPRATSDVNQVDYSSYPHRNSNDIRAKEKRANKCSDLMLACNNKEEVTRFKKESGFSSNEIDWVFHHVLTPSQQQKFNEAASADQLNLLEPPSYDYNEMIAAIDDELIRLGWTTEQARNYLFQTYGVKARIQLLDEQIIEFWQYLKRQ